MKHYSKAVAVLMLLVFGAAASESAIAQHHGGVRFGVNIGIPLFGPGYYSGYYPYPAYPYPADPYPGPDYAYPGPAMAPSGAYAEQGYAQAAPAPAPAPQQDWYYCPNSKSYYPYVRECPGGWQRVPSQPPR